MANRFAMFSTCTHRRHFATRRLSRGRAIAGLQPRDGAHVHDAGQLYTACDMTAPSATVLLRQYQNAVSGEVVAGRFTRRSVNANACVPYVRLGRCP